MAIKNKQAMKRHRQNLKRSALNRHVKSTVRSRTRMLNESIDEKDIEKAREAFIRAQAHIDKAARKGVIHRRTASRKVARLAKKLNLLAASG